MPATGQTTKSAGPARAPASRVLIVAVALTALAVTSRAFAAVASFRGLGYLSERGDGRYSTAGAISRDGHTVAGITGTPGMYFGYRWTAARGMVATPFHGDTLDSEKITGVSDDGSVIVGSHSDFIGGAPSAYRHVDGSNTPGFMPLPFSPPFGVARAVSADGSVAVGQLAFRDGNSTTLFGFRWYPAGGQTVATPNDGTYGDVTGISADGFTIIGTTGTNPAVNQQAYLWSSPQDPVLLGDLPGGGFSSAAKSVSSDGTVVVGLGTSASGPEAFRWTGAGGMLGLGDLPGGAFDSVAVDLSDDGSVIVGMGTSVLGREPFIWDAVNRMRPLQSVLAAAGLNLTGWRLTDVAGVSVDGLTIAGTGIDPAGGTQAWVATLPEPAGVAGVVAMMLVLGRRRRPHRSEAA
jgi:probable HAF family extracellular repeat protein